MSDKVARALAIIALVFMGIFVGALVATLADSKLLGGGIGFVALGSGAVALILFFLLKADGRGFSSADLKEKAEMEKLLKEGEEQAREDETAERSEPENAEEADAATEPEDNTADRSKDNTE